LRTLRAVQPDDSDTRRRRAYRYAECFEKLAAQGVIDSALAERLKAMARFRNLLLHRYWEVDDQRVLTIARNDLSDLEQFVGALSVHFNLGV
jgi:Uncharacterized conserved protein, COG2445